MVDLNDQKMKKQNIQKKKRCQAQLSDSICENRWQIYRPLFSGDSNIFSRLLLKEKNMNEKAAEETSRGEIIRWWFGFDRIVESRKNKGSLNLQVPKTSKKQPVGTMEYFVVHEFFTSLLKKPTGGKKTPTISWV